MSKYTSFAVVGAGVIGTPIVEALLAKGASVVIVTRDGSKSKHQVPAGAKSASVDINDVARVAEVLRTHEVEVLVSTVGGPGLPSQIALADASKIAGVKLFVPSEFGYDTSEKTEGPLGLKNDVAKHLAKIGVPSARIFSGLFSNFIPWLVELDSGKFRIVGKGETRGTFTWANDIAGFTAHILTSLPPSELGDRIFRIQGSSISLLEVAALYEGKAQVEHVEKTSSLFTTILQKVIESGEGAVGGDSNGLWEGHHWKTAKEVLDLTGWRIEKYP